MTPTVGAYQPSGASPRRLAVYAPVLVVALAAWHLRHLPLVFAAVLVATLLVALAEQFSRYVPLGPRLALSWRATC